MKYLFFSIIIIFFSNNAINAQSTATDFTTNDCNGIPHHLFSELDAGKIIVVAFVMPCIGCIDPSLEAYNAVQSYTTSNPDKVLFYLVDDTGNTSCSILTDWGNTNSMPNATKFSSSSFVMSQYSKVGMPLIVVLGGLDHSIAYNQYSDVTSLGVQVAVNNLLSSAEIDELADEIDVDLKVIPNPNMGNALIEYSLKEISEVQIEIFSLTGNLVFKITDNNTKVGLNHFTLNENTLLENGMYVLKLTTINGTENINFILEN